MKLKILLIIFLVLIKNSKQNFMSSFFAQIKSVFVPEQSKSNENQVSSGSDFISIWAPKFAKLNESLNVYYLTKRSNVNDPVDILFNYRNLGYTETIVQSDSFQEITFNNNNLKNNVLLDFNVTLSRKNAQNTQMCLTKQVFKIKTNRNPYQTFIQLDKPIYKPGDIVRIRVIILDNNLKLFHANNIDITLIDPLGFRMIVPFDLDDGAQTMVEGSAIIANEPLFGNWKIEVSVDKGNPTTKNFKVEKYVLPPFEVIIKVERKNYLKLSDVYVTFYGRYSFEENVINANATLILKDLNTLKEIAIRHYIVDKTNVTDVFLGSIFSSNNEHDDYEIFVNLTESITQYTANSTATFKTHKNQLYSISCTHHSSFIPGMPFIIKTFIYDYENNLVTEDNEDVIINVMFKAGDKDFTHTYYQKVADNEVCKFNTDEAHEKFEIEVKFKNSKIYRAVVYKGQFSKVTSHLEMSHYPEKQELGKIVTISVVVPRGIEKLYVIYTTQKGNMEKKIKYCSESSLICTFNTTIDKNKIPSFTVSVYHITEEKFLFYGFTKIATGNLGSNKLSISLTKDKVQPFSHAEIKFRSSETSKVFVLALDKRLLYLAKGNDVTNSDVRKSYENYEGDNFHTFIDLKIDSSWKKCTAEQIELINNSKTNSAQQSTRFRVAREINGTINTHSVSIASENVDESSKEKFREEFPETWIFESFDILAGTEKTKQWKVPDAITSWSISAFAVSKDSAISIAQPRELTVKLDFFLKFFLPYSIRYAEILRVDILVYNYVLDSGNMDVTVTLKNLNKIHSNGTTIKEFEFVESTTTSCTFNKQESKSKTVVVGYQSVKKVSFYIRSNPEDNENTLARNMTLQAHAISVVNDITYKDAVRKKLLVEKVGIRTFTVNSAVFKQNENSKLHEFKDENAREFPNTKVIVSGDKISSNIHLDADNEQIPYGCSEQRRSRFKVLTEVFRYRKSKNYDNKEILEHLNRYYQLVIADKDQKEKWFYGRSSGINAYYLNAFISATELDAFVFDQAVVDSEFDALVDKQKKDGSFESNFPAISGDNHENKIFYDTAYALLPVLKYRNFLKLRNLDLNSKLNTLLTNGIRYLKSFETSLVLNNGLAIAAYAYALDNPNDFIKGKIFLDAIESSRLIKSEDKICYKINAEKSYCEFVHTAFVALTYIAINQTNKAEPIINYLLDSYPKNIYTGGSYSTAIASEAIAKYAQWTVDENTNLNISISTIINNVPFIKSISVTNSPSTKYHEISLPERTEKVNVNVTGQGFCTVISIFEKRAKIVDTTSIIKVTVTPDRVNKTVEIKAKYTKNMHPKTKDFIENVIFEIETPSGYVFANVVEVEKHEAYLRRIDHFNKRTLVHLYFEQFAAGHEYKVKIQLRKDHEVKNLKSSGIKVYDYNIKEYVTIAYYNMEKNMC